MTRRNDGPTERNTQDAAEGRMPERAALAPDPTAIPAQPRVHWRRLVHRRLLIRLTLPGLIGPVLLGFAVGVLLGYPFGHFTRVA